MPSKKDDTGPTLWDFIRFWVIITSTSLLLAWWKGHLVFQS